MKNIKKALSANERQKKRYDKMVDDGFARVPVWIPDNDQARKKLHNFAQELRDADLSAEDLL